MVASASPEVVFRRMIEEAFSGGNLAAVDEVVSGDLVEHEPAFRPANRDGVKAGIAFLHRFAPDFSLTVEALCVQGDLVWARSTARGTHSGPGMGEPTGRRFEITVFDLCRIRDGQIVEHWGVPDRFTQMEQLGLL